MRKYKLQVEQTKTYTSVITVETDMEYEDLDSKLTEIERTVECGMNDLVHALTGAKIKIVDADFDEMGELESLKIPVMEAVE